MPFKRRSSKEPPIVATIVVMYDGRTGKLTLAGLGDPVPAYAARAILEKARDRIYEEERRALLQSLNQGGAEMQDKSNGKEEASN